MDFVKKGGKGAALAACRIRLRTVELVCDGEPVAVQLPAVDVTLVLGNLLDNALEACDALPPQDRWVEVRVIYHAQGNPPVLSLSVVNPSRPVTVGNGQIPTGKGDPLRHGYDLGNVREILSRYRAEATVFYEEGKFVFSADWPDCPR